MPAVPLESFKLIKPDNVESITVWYIKPTSRASKGLPVVKDEEPTTTVRFPGTPDAVDVIVELTRKKPNRPMTFKIAVKACFEVVTGSTTSSAVSPGVSTSTGTIVTGTLLTSSTSSQGYGPSTSSVQTSSSIPGHGPSSTSSESAYVPSTSTGYIVETSSTSQGGYGPSTSTSSETGYVPSTSTGFVETSSSSSEGGVTSTSSVSEYSTTSAGTVCEVIEGMQDPQFIPDKHIRDDRDKVPKDVDNLRPNTKKPFSIDKNTYTLKIWFMPAVPLESFKLIKPDNVESITVWYIKPTSRASKGLPIVADEEPTTTVRFPGQPDSVDIIVEFTRKNPNRPMTFKIVVKACFEFVTRSTISSAVSPGVSTSTGTIVTGVSTVSQYVPSTSSGFHHTSSHTNSLTASSIVTSSSSSASEFITSTAPCTVTTGMDSPSKIPNEDIRTNDKAVNDKINRLRPVRKYPARTHKPNFKITIDLPGVNVDRVELPDNENIKTIVVSYLPVGENTLVPVKDGQPLPANKPVRIPNGEQVTRIVIQVVEKYIEEDPIYITIEIWGCFEERQTTPYETTSSSYISSTHPCEAVSMADNPAYLPEGSIECNDPTINSDMLMTNNPASPASSAVDGFQITINFFGGAALDKLMLPTHTNILSIKILILLPGETNHIPFMGGVAIRVSNEPIQLPSGIMANQVIIIVIEKLDPDTPIFITINIWACFDIMSTPSYSSSTGTTPPTCDLRLIDYSTPNVIASATSQMPAAKAIMALKGSNAFWSPKSSDLEPAVTFEIVARDDRAVVYKVAFTLRFSKSVIIALFNKKGKNVDTSDKIKPHSISHHKHITYNFYGQAGDKIVIYVQTCRETMPQVSNVEIHACFDDELEYTTLEVPTTELTTLPPVCDYMCDNHETCLGGNKLCDGNCDCYDCTDEDNCATQTPPPPGTDGEWGTWSPWSKCNCQGTITRVRRCDSPRPSPGGKYCRGQSAQTKDCERPDECDKCDEGYMPVVEQGKIVDCGGFVGKKCPKKNDVCELNPRSTLGTCCRPIDFWTEWGEWSSCSRDCGDGTETRTRVCTSKNPNKDCPEDSEQTQSCNEGPCEGTTSAPYTLSSGVTPYGPVGEWSTWSPWSRCTRSCGYGVETRTRTCSNPAPGPNGKPCRGTPEEERECRKKACPTGPPNWSPWSPWSECDVHCGIGKRTRTRACDSPAPGPDDEYCPGDDVDTTLCTQRPCECSFTMKGFENIFGYEPAEQVGWIENDGEFGPTDPDEDVFVEDTFEEGVVVHVDCSNCTCTEGLIDCELGECEECTYTKWSQWTECSKSCDVGQRERTRRLRNKSKRPSKCKPELTDREDCNLDPCPTVIPPQWNPWSSWSECVPVGACVMVPTTRTRECSIQPNSNCYGDSIQTKSCDTACLTTPSECDDGMVWSECANRCPHTCLEVRLDTCQEDEEEEECVPGCTCPDNKVLFDGQCIPERKCPCYDEEGNAVLQNMVINKGPCETCTCTNGSLECTQEPECCEWSTWGPWGGCSDTCGDATRNRYRTLTNGDPYTCGDEVDTEDCTYKPCPADCKIRGVPYHIGDVTRELECEVCHCTTHGEECETDPHKVVDGGWSPWTQWSVCSSSCNGGMSNRVRKCNSPLAKCGGEPCEGDNIMWKSCNSKVPCCVTTAWSEWSECSVTCDEGIRTRLRTYENVTDRRDCDEVLEQAETCFDHPCDMECNVTQWTEWSECSQSCGVGKKTRRRRIRGDAVSDCPPLVDTADCFEKECPCGKNMEYTNHTLCEHTCENRFDGPPRDCEDTIKEGCICKEGYYRDANDVCVRSNECDVCYVDGEPKLPGETWEDPDKCEHCECVAGQVECSPECEIPTCEEDETLTYDSQNPCCPRCEKRKDTCSLKTRTDFLYDPSSQCKSISRIEFTYCEGSCGNSTSLPWLMFDSDGTLDNDCRCCTGDIGSYKEVNVLCGEGIKQKQKTALVPVIVGCNCHVCTGTSNGERTRMNNTGR